MCTSLLACFAAFFAAVHAFSPNVDSEFTFVLPAGSRECFYQTTVTNGSMEVEYQVLVVKHTNTSQTHTYHKHNPDTNAKDHKHIY